MEEVECLIKIYEFESAYLKSLSLTLLEMNGQQWAQKVLYIMVEDQRQASSLGSLCLFMEELGIMGIH